MFCQECGKDIPQGSKSCPECGFNFDTGGTVEEIPPVTETSKPEPSQSLPPVQGDVRQTSPTPQVAPQQPATQFDAGVSRGNSDLVYPKNPPLSPHMCWLNLVWWGPAQIAFGQTAKGVLLIFVCMFLLCTGVGAIIMLLGFPFIIFDSYKVGKTLASGKPVGKWSFFPSP